MMFRQGVQLAYDLSVCMLVLATVACSGSAAVPLASPSLTTETRASTSEPSRISASSPIPTAMTVVSSSSTSAASCPITRPPNPPLTPPPSIMETRTAPNTFWYGNEGLWLLLPVDGVMWSRKEMWWRTVPGQMTIEGTRLDAPAPPLESFLPSGYGDIGFQASGIVFPVTGCWEVVGKIADKELRFVVTVVPSPITASSHP